jgi:CRP-like cAMP-binding protein
MKTSAEIEQVIACIPLFDGITRIQRKTMASRCLLRTASRGEAVFLEGENPRALYYLVSGQVKRSVCSHDGSEKVLDVHCSGEFFGEAELFSQSVYEVRAEPTAVSELLHIGRNAISELLRQHPRIGLRMLEAVALRHHALEHIVVSRRFQGTSDRVLEYFCGLAPAERQDGWVSLSLNVPKQVLASHLDMTPETLSRTLRRLSDDGLLDVKGRQVRLDMHAIKRRDPTTSPVPRPASSSPIRVARSRTESRTAGGVFPRPAYP